jgi:hypothetical protein
LAVDIANKVFVEAREREIYHEQQERIKKDQHKKNIDEVNRRLNFDE